MIQYTKGNIFESDAMALVNTVNLKGVMGKGVALQFKTRFPMNFKEYQKACADGRIGIGRLFVCEEQTLMGKRFIINFPTKDDWRKPAEYVYIEAGLDDLVRIINRYGITSVAIPPLGAGNGGLQWERVKQIIEDKLAGVGASVIVYEPTQVIVDRLRSERVKLTDARALLLYVLFDLVKQGEDVSEFSCEKVCYFLQRFGAQNIFNLQYRPCYYGPYSGKVRYVLQYMNGSYLMGYSDMNRKPFEPLSLIADSYADVNSYVEDRNNLMHIATSTKAFLSGYYSDFGLELLSSVDYILHESPNSTVDEVHTAIKNWNHRKSVLFMDRNHIERAYQHIKENMLVVNTDAIR